MVRDVIMINTRIRKLLNLVLLGSVLLIFTNEKVNRCIDDAVLLENRNPGYYEYLSNSDIYYVSKAALDEPNDNLLVNTMQTKNFSDKGFEILVHEDGSFTFSGTYTGEEPMYIYPMEIGNLKSGDYILSDGGASVDKGIQARIFGVRELSNGEREYGNSAVLPGDEIFHWDDTKYDYAKFDVVISPGFSANNLRFYPILLNEKHSGMKYQSALRKLSYLSDNQNREDYVSYLSIKMKADHISKLSKSDWQILCNEARYQKKVNWISVDLCDGTGIQIKDNNLDEILKGEVDCVGRVRNSF